MELEDALSRRSEILSRLSDSDSLSTDKYDVDMCLSDLSSLHCIFATIDQKGTEKDALISLRERMHLCLGLRSMFFCFYQLAQKSSGVEQPFVSLKRRLKLILSPTRSFLPTTNQFITNDVAFIRRLGEVIRSMVFEDTETFLTLLCIEYFLIDALFILIFTNNLPTTFKPPCVQESLLFKAFLTLLGILHDEAQKQLISKQLSQMITSSTFSVGSYLKAAGAFEPSQPQEVTLQLVKVVCVKPATFTGNYLLFLAENLSNIINLSKNPLNPSEISSSLARILISFILALEKESFSIDFLQKIEETSPNAKEILSRVLSTSHAADEKITHAQEIVKLLNDS